MEMGEGWGGMRRTALIWFGASLANRRTSERKARYRRVGHEMHVRGDCFVPVMCCEKWCRVSNLRGRSRFEGMGCWYVLLHFPATSLRLSCFDPVSARWSLSLVAFLGSNAYVEGISCHSD